MKGLKKANNTLQEFSDLVESKQVSSHNRKNLRVGIDLGTSSIVLYMVPLNIMNPFEMVSLLTMWVLLQ